MPNLGLSFVIEIELNLVTSVGLRAISGNVGQLLPYMFCLLTYSS